MNPYLLQQLMGSIGEVPPPGCISTFVPHPYLGERGSVEVVFMFEHRFAFTCWVNWIGEAVLDQGLDQGAYKPPDLITWDWHDDTGGECDYQEKLLSRLDTGNKRDVAMYAWAGLRQQNDGHISPAVWLNALGDVYVIQKQRDLNDCEQFGRVQTDRYGNEHQFRYFRDLESFSKEYEAVQGDHGVYWDVDLDFFTSETGNPDLRFNPKLSESAVRSQLDPNQTWMQQILCNLKGLTIALEPDYTGGLSSSLELYRIFESALFESPIYSESCKWKRWV